MSASVAKNCSVFVDGYDLSCAFKEVKMAKNAQALDSTALCTTGDKSFVAGLKDGTLSLTGFFAYDGTTLDKIENVLETAFSAQANLITSCSLGALAVGGVAFMCRGGQTKHDVESVLDTLIMSNSDIRAAGNIMLGKWLFDASVNATTSVGSSVDNGAASANGGTLHFHVFGPDGSISDASVLIEHSVDGSTWATLINTTAIGASHGAVAVEVAAGTTVRRYLRATVVTTGGAATCAAAFFRAV
jgi:hypothetical protein